jgi:hypothetical protein
MHDCNDLFHWKVIVTITGTDATAKLYRSRVNKRTMAGCRGELQFSRRGKQQQQQRLPDKPPNVSSIVNQNTQLTA